MILFPNARHDPLRLEADLIRLRLMRRGMQIIVTLLAIVMLTTPYDCFATAKSSQDAMDCCLKGQCVPTAQSDGCCKNTSPDTGVLGLSKAPSHAAPVAALAAIAAPSTPPRLGSDDFIDSFDHPPPRIGLVARNLPLII